MRANPIVVTAPALDNDLRLAQCVEDLAIEQFVTQACIEAFDKAVFPRAAGSDVSGLFPDGADPFLHRLSTAVAEFLIPQNKRMAGVGGPNTSLP